MKSHYESWHEKKYHTHVHFTAFAVYAALLAGTILGFATSPQSLNAGSDFFVYTTEIGDPPTTINIGKGTLQTDKDSAIANGTDTITINAGSFTYDDPNSDDPTVRLVNPIPGCYDNGNQKAEIKVGVSGSGNTLSPTYQYINCSTGLATFTLKSTTPETKTINYYTRGKGGFDVDPVTGELIPAESWIKDENLSLSVNFTAAPASNPVSTSNTATTSTKTVAPKNTTENQTATQAPETKVESPITEEKPLLLTKVNETDFSSDSTENIFEEAKKFKLSGKTFPNAKVTLYVYSEPFIAQTTANTEGYWEYEVTKELEPGGHRVEAEVTKQDGTLIPKKEIASFRIAAASTKNQAIGQVSTKKKISPITYYSLGAVALLLGAITAAVILKKKKHQTK